MQDSDNRLIWQFTISDEWPEPQLLQDIMARGQALVPELLDYLAEIGNEDVPIEAICLAALMLGQMHVVAAIPKLIHMYYAYSEDYLEDITRALILLGVEALDPMLAAIQDEELDWYGRALLLEGVRDIVAAAPTAESSARAAVVLRDLLASYIAEAEDLSEDQMSIAGSLVATLAQWRDPDAHPLIEHAFAAEIIDEFDIDASYVDELYAGLAPAASLEAERWFEFYTTRYESHLEDIEPAARPQIVAHTLGRNAPCWCGSGKKYKHCHMRQDEQQRRNLAAR